MNKGWRNEPGRHSLASKGIKTAKQKALNDAISRKVRNYGMMNLNEDDIVKVYNYNNYPVVIVDTFTFGGTWSHEDDLIIIDAETYSSFSDEYLEYLVKHEIEEMQLAKKDEQIDEVPHTQMVKRYHEKANERIADDFTNRELKSLWLEVYENFARDENIDEREAIKQADYILSGTGITHKDMEGKL